jgi:hypothetical protein
MAITDLKGVLSRQYHSDRDSQAYFSKEGLQKGSSTTTNLETGKIWETPIVKNYGDALSRERGLNYSPLHKSLTNLEESSSQQGYKAHSFEHINPYKVCEVAITNFNNGFSLGNTSPSWGNWRDENVQVYDQVFLWPREKTWTTSYENKYESAYAKLEQNGMFSKVSQITESIRSLAVVFNTITTENEVPLPSGGRFMSKYKYAPAWSGTTPIQLPSSLTFDFRFGQAGIFSAEHEVMRPIIALILPFVPKRDKGKYNYFKGPTPTAPTFMYNFWKYVAQDFTKYSTAMFEGGSMNDNLKPTDPKAVDPDAPISPGAPTDYSDQGMKAWSEKNRQYNEEMKRYKETKEAEKKSDATGAVKMIDTLTNLENEILNSINNAVKDTLSSEDSTFLNVRIGNMVFPPLVVHTVSWTFDMTNTDEFGYPTAGSVSFTGLEGIEMTTQDTIANLYPYIPMQIMTTRKDGDNLVTSFEYRKPNILEK